MRSVTTVLFLSLIASYSHGATAKHSLKRIRPDSPQERILAIAAPDSCESQYYQFTAGALDGDANKLVVLPAWIELWEKLRAEVPEEQRELGQRAMISVLTNRSEALGHAIPPNDPLRALAIMAVATELNKEYPLHSFLLGRAIAINLGTPVDAHIQECLSQPKSAGVRGPLLKPTLEQIHFRNRIDYEFLKTHSDKEINRLKQLLVEPDNSDHAETIKIWLGQMEISAKRLKPEYPPTGLDAESVTKVDQDAKRMVTIQNLCVRRSEVYKKVRRIIGVSNFAQILEHCFLLDSDAAEAVAALTRKYRVQPRVPQSIAMYLETQLPEAKLDFLATEFAAAWIEALPPAERKDAAVKLLQSLPPTLYPPAVRETLDYVGHTLTNDTRALRIVLANPKIQAALGCRFKDEAPRYCGAAP